MNDYNMTFIRLTDQQSVKRLQNFLSHFDLSYEVDEIDFTLIMEKKGEIIATGSLSGNILRNIAIDPTLQGQGLTATIVTELIQQLADKGEFHYFLYTKPENSSFFIELGFELLVLCQNAALLEGGLGGLSHYLKKVKQQINRLAPQRAALVMKCDPFTLGHRFLIEQAAAENEAVIVFVVSEEQTMLPFKDRLMLVKQGTADLPNVEVTTTGPYQVSQATFPTYFTKGAVQQQAPIELDVRLFGEKIAPALGIVTRYVGEEPFCETTALYNTTMLQILPQLGIEVKVIPRKKMDSEIISASRVRQALADCDWLTIKSLLPITSFDYLYQHYQ